MVKQFLMMMLSPHSSSPRSRGRPADRKKKSGGKVIVKCVGCLFACIPIMVFAFILSYGPHYLESSLKTDRSDGNFAQPPASHPRGLFRSMMGDFNRKFKGAFGRSAPPAVAKSWSSLIASERSQFLIYVYDLPEKFNRQVLRESWRCGHHMFAAEVAFHKYLLKSNVRTKDPSKATMFYIPTYTTCKTTTFAGNGPDPWFGRNLMVEAISWVSSTFPYWNRRQGRDHIVSATHDYGACYDYLRNSAHRAGIVSELKKSIILSTFGDTKSKCFNADHHITIPTYLAVPSLGINSKRMRADWSKAVGLQLPLAVDDPSTFDDTKRTQACFFWGALEWTDANGRIDESYSHGVRQTLRKLYADDPWFVLKHVTRDGDGKIGLDQYAEHLKRSVFCLAPAGFAPWSARIYEAIHYGCIPVIIADTIILPFDDQLPWREFSVKISEADLKVPGKMKDILKSITAVEIKKKQNILVNIARVALMYQFPSYSENSELAPFGRAEIGGSAFDYIIRGLEIKAGKRRVTKESAKIRQKARVSGGWQ